MYNPDLEALIDAALADGELTEKEKQILFKKAQAMGVDLDEFEMVLDARLVKLKKAEQERAASSAPKSNKLGDVKKCPACGAMVQSFQGMCSECGYAFENLNANNSTQKLSEIIDKVMVENNSLQLKEGMSPHDLEKEKKQRIVNAIQNFPIPTTKSDLFEFITSLQPKTSGKYGKAYKAKLEECILKAKSLFPNDKMFADLVEKYEKQKADKKAKTKKILLIGIPAVIIIVVALIIIIGAIQKSNDIKKYGWALKPKVIELVQHGDVEKAEQYVWDFNPVYWFDDDAEEACISIIQYYIGNGESDKAISFCDKIAAKYSTYTTLKADIGKPIMKYLISEKQYLEAEAYVDKDSQMDYEEYVVACITEMAKDGKKKEAKEFFNKSVNYFKDRYSTQGWESAQKKYMDLIDKY